MKASEKTQCQCLIIEDNIPAAELMKIFLEKHSIWAETAADGKMGLKKYLADPTRYHIIFLDIQMPGMDGYEVAKRIRESGSENAATIPIVAMSGSNTGDVSANGHFNLFLRKPFEFRSLHDLLNNLLQT